MEDQSALKKQAQVISACEEAFRTTSQADPKTSACNIFVTAVLKTLRVSDDFHGLNANQIFSKIQKKPWVCCGAGEAGARRGAVEAARGNIVIGARYGAPGKDDKGHGHVDDKGHGHVDDNAHGHVMVLVRWDYVRHRPIGFWGRLHVGGKSMAALTYSVSAYRTGSRKIQVWHPNNELPSRATGAASISYGPNELRNESRFEEIYWAYRDWTPVN